MSKYIPKVKMADGTVKEIKFPYAVIKSFSIVGQGNLGSKTFEIPITKKEDIADFKSGDPPIIVIRNGSTVLQREDIFLPKFSMLDSNGDLSGIIYENEKINNDEYNYSVSSKILLQVQLLSGSETIIINQTESVNLATKESVDNKLDKTGGVMTGDLVIEKGSKKKIIADRVIEFNDHNNPVMTFQTGGTKYYLQAVSNQFGMGLTWAKATRWDTLGNMSVFGNLKINNGKQVATTDDIPTNNNQLENGAGYLTEHQDISGKQDKIIAGANIVIGDDGKTISAKSGLKISKVATLPATGDTDTVYIKLKEAGTEQDIYDEYIYVDNKWEHIGNTAIDLTDYATIEQVNKGLTQKVNSVSTPYTIYGTKGNGDDYSWKLLNEEEGNLTNNSVNGIPKYNFERGTLSTNTPITNLDCANKKYVDDELAKKQPKGEYLTEHQTLKTINSQSIVGTGNINIPTGTQLTQTQINNINDIPNKQPKGDYATTTQLELINTQVEKNKTNIQDLVVNRGTLVTVANVPRKEVTFTQNPQVQLDDLKAKKQDKLSDIQINNITDIPNKLDKNAPSKYSKQTWYLTNPDSANVHISQEPTGAFEIALPYGWDNAMISFVVQIYDIGTNKGQTFLVGGYTYVADKSWYCPFALALSDGSSTKLNVRFGTNEEGKACVWFGELNTNWRYPTVSIRDVSVGYQGDAEKYKNGWGIRTVTKFHNVTNTQDISNTNIATLNDINGKIGKTDLLTYVYPVGSIYMSTNNTSPASFLGGTWEQLKDRFLLGAGSTYSLGSTGGSADAVLVKHSHTYSLMPAKDVRFADGQSTNWVNAHWGASYSKNRDTSTVGENGHLKNLPPYLVVNMWKRTA